MFEKKQNQEKDITPDKRKEKIDRMLEIFSHTVGVGPFTRQHTETVMENMIRRGVLSRNEPYEMRYQRTIKSLVKTWAQTNLQMPPSTSK